MVNHKRVKSTLRNHPEHAESAREMLLQRRSTPSAASPMSDEELTTGFIDFAATSVAWQYGELLKTQQSISLQRISTDLENMVRGHLWVTEEIATYREQESLSETSARRLSDWVANGGLSERVEEMYEATVSALEGAGFKVSILRKGVGNEKRGRVRRSD